MALFAVGVAVLIIGAALIINHEITIWIGGPGFQDLLDRETSRGLKLQANYGKLHRVGIFGLWTDQFNGANGDKTIVTLQAQDISGIFNPLGVILRYWEIDSMHLKSGSVMLQKTEVAPGAGKGAPWPPWWALFWPYRVYLADVKVDNANILWKLRHKESGIYGTHLEITPNWKDYEYDAHGGKFAMPVSPTLDLVHAHVLIRRPRLYCSEFILSDDAAHPENGMRAVGDAGLQDDRSVHLKVILTNLMVAPWVPRKYRSHVEGKASGHFDYISSDTGLETGQGDGEISVANGILRDLPQAHQYAALTGSPDPGTMALKVCQADVHWKAGAISVENIEVECDKVFRLTGAITIASDKTLSGQVEFGLTEPYLRWLSTGRTAIFTRDEGPYHFATIHFSGTAQKPKQDLSVRIANEVGKSPALMLKLFFDQVGEWFHFN